MESQYLHRLIQKNIDGSATIEEQEELLKWIAASEENRAYYEEVKHYEDLAARTNAKANFDKQAAWKRVKSGYELAKLQKQNEQESKKKKYRVLRLALSAAASVILAFYIGTYWGDNMKSASDDTVVYHKISAPLGSKSEILLPDSSVVWLNAGSSLRYSSDFNKDSRTVELQGEGFFDIRKNFEKKFIIKTSEIDIKVYGTKFNLKAYPEDLTIATSLEEGTVSIIKSDAPNAEELFLRPDQKMVYYKHQIELEHLGLSDNEKEAHLAKRGSFELINNIDMAEVKDWKDNRWVIVNQDLGELSKEFERRFKVQIAFADPDIRAYTFTGTLEDESLEQILQVIQLSAPIKYTIQNDTITLQSDPKFKRQYDQLLNR